jgi:hypothetical protein
MCIAVSLATELNQAAAVLESGLRGLGEDIAEVELFIKAHEEFNEVIKGLDEKFNEGLEELETKIDALPGQQPPASTEPAVVPVPDGSNVCAIPRRDDAWSTDCDVRCEPVGGKWVYPGVCEYDYPSCPNDWYKAADGREWCDSYCEGSGGTVINSD